MAQRECLADGGGGCGMTAGKGLHERASPRHQFIAAGKHNKLDTRRQALRLMPSRQRGPLIPTHDPEQPRSGKSLAHRFRRLVRIRHPPAPQLKIIHRRPRQFRGCTPQHLHAIIHRRGRLQTYFMRRNPTWQKPDFIQCQGRLCLLGHINMAEMDRIKGPAKQRDFADFRHSETLTPSVPDARPQVKPGMQCQGAASLERAFRSAL